nr:MAG TPA: hypothetical protein [Caudoviricetes sp.]
MLLPTLRRQTFSSFLLSFFISKAFNPFDNQIISNNYLKISFNYYCIIKFCVIRKILP